MKLLEPRDHLAFEPTQPRFKIQVIEPIPSVRESRVLAFHAFQGAGRGGRHHRPFQSVTTKQQRRHLLQISAIRRSAEEKSPHPVPDQFEFTDGMRCQGPSSLFEAGVAAFGHKLLVQGREQLLRFPARHHPVATDQLMK